MSGGKSVTNEFGGIKYVSFNSELCNTCGPLFNSYCENLSTHGHVFQNAEAAFQMRQSAVTYDIDSGTELIQRVAADKAKLIGRDVKELNLETCANDSLETLQNVLRSKMQQNTKLHELLLQSNVATQGWSRQAAILSEEAVVV